MPYTSSSDSASVIDLSRTSAPPPSNQNTQRVGSVAASPRPSSLARDSPPGDGKHRFFIITELSHVIHPSGERPGRTVRTTENDRRRAGGRQERLARRN